MEQNQEVTPNVEKDTTPLFPVTPATLKVHAASVAQAIHDEFGRKKFIYAGVGMGGFHWAALVLEEMNKLNFPYMRKEVVIAKAYDGTKRRENTEVRVAGSRHVWEKATVVLMDDIVDTGLTMRAVASALVENMGVRKVCAGAMFLKELPEDSMPPFVRTQFCGFRMPRSLPFIAGFGLDYNGEYRDLEYVDLLSNIQKREEGQDGSSVGSSGQDGGSGEDTSESPAPSVHGDSGQRTPSNDGEHGDE